MSERNRISSGSAVPTRITPKAPATLPPVVPAPGECGMGMNPRAIPTTINTGAVIRNPCAGRAAEDGDEKKRYGPNDRWAGM